MRITGNRIQRCVATAMTLILGLYASGGAYAATCKDELDRFERRLHSSSLEAEDPDTYYALAHQAEEAAELRDEQQCLETVAAMNDVVPEDGDAGVQTSAGEDSAPGPAHDKSTDKRSSSSRPAAPVLMMAGDDDADESDDKQKPATSGSGDQESLED